MDFLEMTKTRFSVREFSNKKVEEEKLQKILEAARVAPTACNKQPQRIFVIQEEQALKKMKNCTRFDFDAPLIFIICYDKTESWKRSVDGKDGGEVDASIVTTHMMFEAMELGLGTTWVGSFNPMQVRKEYDIPEAYEIVSILPTGYPSENAKPSKQHEERKEIKQMVKYVK